MPILNRCPLVLKADFAGFAGIRICFAFEPYDPVVMTISCFVDLRALKQQIFHIHIVSQAPFAASVQTGFITELCEIPLTENATAEAGRKVNNGTVLCPV